MIEHSETKEPKFYVVHLTSLRGIACLVVLAGHAIQVVNYHYADSGTFLGAMRNLVDGAFNAEGAVLLFFVLSGCVLSLSLRNIRKFDIWVVGGFYVRRVFRLYPLLWFSLALGALSMMVGAKLADSGAFTGWLKLNVLSGISVRHTLMSVTAMYTRYNGPIWSLRAELIYSALFPGIYLCMKNPGYRKLAVPLLLAVAALPIPHDLSTSYGISFAAGALIPMLRAPDRRLALAAVVIALIVLLFDRFALAPLHPYDNLYDIIETAASFIIVRDIYNSGFRYGLLLARPIVVTGELSFSIYLLHLPIFLILFTLAARAIGLPALLDHPALSQLSLGLSTTAATLLIAFFTYTFIELPMHNLGRRLARQVGSRAAPQDQVSYVPASRTPVA